MSLWFCYGWYPKNREETQKWYASFIGITVELGKTSTTTGSAARALLGSAFRGLWTNADMGEALTKAARELATVDGWLDGWIGIRNTLSWDKKELVGDSLAALKALEKELAPQDLLAKIRAKVLSRGVYGADLEDESEPESGVAWYQKAQEEAEALGRAAAVDENALADLTPYVCRTKSTEKSGSFGFGIGQAAISTWELLDRIKHIVGETKLGDLNTVFIRGLISGWNKSNPAEVDAFLDSALSDGTWGAIFPELQVAIGLDDLAHSRLIRCLESGNAPSSQFQYLGIGRATDPLSVKQVASLISRLATKSDNGLAVAIDILDMVIHCADNKNEEYLCELQAYCLKFIGQLDWASIDLRNDSFTRNLARIIECGLSGIDPHGEASNALSRLIHLERSNAKIFPRRLGRILMPFFKRYPYEALNACYFQDNGGSYNSTLRLVSVELDERGDTAISAVPEEALMDWCLVSPDDRCPFVAQTCKFMEKLNSDRPDDEHVNSISSTAKSVLAHAPDKKKVLEIFVDRCQPMFWPGSRSLILRKRLELLDQLNPNDDEALQVLIDEAKTSLSKIIEREEWHEQDWERSRTASFE
jgi:hypothetical protein